MSFKNSFNLIFAIVINLLMMGFVIYVVNGVVGNVGHNRQEILENRQETLRNREEGFKIQNMLKDLSDKLDRNFEEIKNAKY